LQGFSLKDSPEFEQWALAKREYYKRLALHILNDLAQACQQSGDNEQALAYARRQLELEPWLEEAHRQVMRLLVIGGQRSAALIQYETCRRLLKDELDAEPGEETILLYEQIRSGIPTVPHTPIPNVRPGVSLAKEQSALPTNS
jgi:DNA-binding SARP family transcriptional activator